jgi:nitrite reductase/ring-hydroxylating ferredoxin subunit
VSPTGSCEGCGAGGTRRQFLRDCLGFGVGIFLVRGRVVSAAPPVVRYPLPAQDVALIDRDNDVILVRWQGAAYAFSRSCPHQNTALLWLEQDARFQCPKHKSRYQPDGEFISGRATRSMDRFALKLEGNEVVVDVGTLYRQDKDPVGWAGAMLKLG